MKKINFNDRYILTRAVIDEIKNNTRRIEGGTEFQEMAQSADQIFYNEDTGLIDFMYEGIDIFNHEPHYKVGEIVAVAQSYENTGVKPYNYISRPEIDGFQIVSTHKGWRNKLFVRAEWMPHQIRITGIKCERLQDISDADCLREGIRYIPEICKFYFEDVRREEGFYFDNHREAFASLIDKVSGRGTWASNPWVVAYEFELLK